MNWLELSWSWIERKKSSGSLAADQRFQGIRATRIEFVILARGWLENQHLEPLVLHF